MLSVGLRSSVELETAMQHLYERKGKLWDRFETDTPIDPQKRRAMMDKLTETTAMIRALQFALGQREYLDIL